MSNVSNPSEFYVGACFDFYENGIYKQTGFYVYLREMVGATSIISNGLVDVDTLTHLTQKYNHLISKNSDIVNGQLVLLDTVERVVREVPTGFVISNSIVPYQENYVNSFWWLLDMLNQMDGSIVLGDNKYTQPLSNLRFSRGTFTLYYSYLKEDSKWSSYKLLWYTDKFHRANDLRVKVSHENLFKNKYATDLLKLAKDNVETEEEGQSLHTLTFDLNELSMVTKTLKDIALYTPKEFIINDIITSELTNVKIAGAGHAKFLMEKLMEVQATEDFREYTATGIKQMKNLKFDTVYSSPKRIVIENYFNQDDHMDKLIKTLETEDDSHLDDFTDFIIEKFGLTIYSRDYCLGFVNSLRTDQEGFFDYKNHNLHMQQYRKESFNSNLNLHKERIQMFLHKHTFGEETSTAVLVGGEYRTTVIVEMEGYDD